ncbi:MAG: CxxC-x17-CxxC domain-containing protein [Patiriisocius sp.]|jgi:CxxC-x17-CxxC domain-containing protein
MNNFKGGGFKKRAPKFEGKKSFGGDKKFGGGQRRDDRREGAPAEQFSATCSDCHKKCDVPFKPSNDKPVYCSGCFGNKKNANESRGSGKNERPDYTKLPREQRPARHDASRGDGIMDLKRQISGLEVKLNKILDLVNPPMPSAKVPLPVKEVAPAEASKKEVSKKAPTKKDAPKKEVVTVAAKVAPKKAAAKKVVAKKVVSKAALKKVVAKVTKKVVPKKAAKKVVAKKVVKKVAKVAAKKVVKKTKK